MITTIIKFKIIDTYLITVTEIINNGAQQTLQISQQRKGDRSGNSIYMLRELKSYGNIEYIQSVFDEINEDSFNSRESINNIGQR